MEQIKCPGQDTRHWKPDDIFTLECPKCGTEIEFFKDDTRRRCAWCGHLFYNRTELHQPFSGNFLECDLLYK